MYINHIQIHRRMPTGNKRCAAAFLGHAPTTTKRFGGRKGKSNGHIFRVFKYRSGGHRNAKARGNHVSFLFFFPIMSVTGTIKRRNIAKSCACYCGSNGEAVPWWRTICNRETELFTRYHHEDQNIFYITYCLVNFNQRNIVKEGIWPFQEKKKVEYQVTNPEKTSQQKVVGIFL